MVTILRTVLIYMVLISVIRLMGKRQLGQLEPSELVVTMLVADLAAAPIQDPALFLPSALVPIGVILLLELLLSTACLRSLFLRKLLCGKPVILIENGRLLRQNLRSTRVTLDELVGCLRQKNVLDIRQVQYAILETGGSLSVFVYPEEAPATARDAGIRPQGQSLPVTLVSDGRLLKENLPKAGKDAAWVEKTLKKRSVTLADTLLFTVDDQDRVYLIPMCPDPEK